MRHFLLIVFITIAINAIPFGTAHADLTPEPVVRLSIRPVATTQPSLQYKLLPDLTDQTPGNAATLYLIGSKMGPDRKEALELERQASDYLDLPLDQVPRDKAEQVLASFPSRLRMSDLAAHRQDVQWDYSLREEGVDALLPYLNDMRGLDNLWSLQARLRILDNDWSGAARIIEDRLSLARQLNHQAVEVQGLVEAGIVEETMARGIRDWISHGDSPNLYWSLSSLPQPFVDVHEIAVWEQSVVYFTFPILRESKDEPSDPARWRAFLAGLPGLTGSQFPRPRNTLTNQLQVAMLAAAAQPLARAYLLSHGHTPAQVDAMSVDQAVGTYFAEQYRRLNEDAWRAWELPFWEGRADLQRQTAEVSLRQRGPGGNPLAAFVPALERARYQFARVDREIALLRIVEAVRDYAARHDGSPPASLEQIKDLPVPIDPVRGQPFRYEQHGQTVTIEALPYDKFPIDGERYELTIVK